MINRGLIYGILIMLNLVLVKGTVLAPLKIESSPLHVYKTGLDNEFDYLLKRSGSQNVDESPDSKERRSQMGSSFIRFGRNHYHHNQGSLESPDDSTNNLNNFNSAASRTPRGRSDVIIRFGRAGLPNIDIQQSPSLSKSITIPLNLSKLAVICPTILSTTESTLHNDLLVRLCTLITSQSSDNIDNNNY